MPKRPVDVDNSLDYTDLDSHSADLLEDYGRDDYKNQNGILLFNDKKYATGLTWLTSSEFENDGSVYKKAKSLSCDFYCTRLFISQNGFGTIKLKHKMGMPSIAAMAADALVGEWHGVFAADNGWLYVAVHADNIAPDGDLFFLSEEDAYNHFKQEANRYRWPKTYVPESWNFKNNDGEIPLAKVVEDISTTTLKPANLNAFFGSTANKNLALIALLIVGGLLAVLSLSQSLFTQIIPKRIEAPAQQLKLSNSLSVPPKEPVKEKDPVQVLLEKTTLPSPSHMLAACVENFDSLMVSIPGWDIKQMRCRGNLVEGVWKRGVGSLDTLRDSIDQFPFGISKTYSADGSFLAAKIIPDTNSFNRPLILSRREDALIDLNNRFSGIGNLQVKDLAPKAQDNNQNDKSKKRKISFDDKNVMTLDHLPSLVITLKTDVSPTEIKESLSFPSLKFNVIEWNIKSSQWIYNMQVYLYPANYRNDKI